MVEHSPQILASEEKAASKSGDVNLCHVVLYRGDRLIITAETWKECNRGSK